MIEDSKHFINEEKTETEKVPELIILTDEEKFKDENGNMIEIETRGVKTFDGIFFYGKDVEKMLNIIDISTILTNENSSYEKNTHYKKFRSEEHTSELQSH